MIILPFLVVTSLVATPSITITPTLTAVVPTEAVATSEIQKFREIIQEKVKTKLQEISQTNSTDLKRGYLGTITKIDSNQINLDSVNKNYQINLNPDTTYLNAKSVKIKVADLKVGQEILAIGLLDDQNNLSAKRIIVTTPKSTQNQKTTIYGQVVDVSTTNPIIAIIPSSNKNLQYQVKTDTKNLQVLSKTGDKLTTKSITKGKKVIIISTSAPIVSQTLSAEKIIMM